MLKPNARYAITLETHKMNHLRNISSIIVQILLQIDRKGISWDFLCTAKISDCVREVALVSRRSSHIAQRHLRLGSL